MSQQPPKTNRVIRATSKLSSWLRAVNVPHEPQIGGWLLVTGTDGTEARVVVIEGPSVAPLGTMEVPLDLIWSRDMGTALSAFHMVTQALGYGSPQPVPVRMTSSSYELTHHDYWMRWTEVVISPNPDPEVFTQYKPIVDTQVRRFCSSPQNRYLMREVGIDADDIENLARSWICSYECIHKILLSTDHDNEKLLHSYLKQRFVELHSRLKARSANHGCLPVEGELLSHLIERHRYKEGTMYLDSTPSIEDSVLADLESVSTYRERKSKAKGMLRKALKTMGKRIAIQKLEDIATKPGTPSEIAQAACEQLEQLTRKRKKNGPTLH